MWLALSQPTRCCPGGQCLRPRSETIKDDQLWPSVTDALINRTVERYAPAFVHYDSGTDADAGMCYNVTGMQSPQQWAKLRALFDAIL